MASLPLPWFHLQNHPFSRSLLTHSLWHFVSDFPNVLSGMPPYVRLCLIGGAFGYLIGWGVWEAVDEFFLGYVFSLDNFLYVSRQYEDNAFLAILAAAFTPIPYKVFTVAAGVFKINLLTLIVASVIGRSGRFFLAATLIYFFGARVKILIDKYFNLFVTLFFALVVLGFVVVKYWIK